MSKNKFNKRMMNYNICNFSFGFVGNIKLEDQSTISILEEQMDQKKHEQLQKAKTKILVRKNKSK